MFDRTSGAVPAIVPLSIARFARMRGYPVSELFDGLGWTPERSPSASRVRIPWDEAALLFDRLERCDPEALSAYADYYLHEVPVIRWISLYVHTEGALYPLIFFAWARVWPALRFEHERTNRGWLLRARIAPEHRACGAFLRLVTQILIRLPRIVGGSDAHVEAYIADARTAQWGIIVRPEPGMPDPKCAPATIFAMVELDLKAGPAATRIPEAWSLTPSESRVALELACGRSLREIAVALGVGEETVRTHAKRAMAKAGVHRQAELVARILAPEGVE
jgi:DNA-binding CsgD family transcriptional regulator